MSAEFAIVLFLILLNGFFALSEMAVMTARRNRLRQLAKESRRARVALELAERPERFLSAVQVWITMLGILTGYFGGESIAAQFEVLIRRLEPLAQWAEPISIALAVGLILFISVVLGELVPKRVAIQFPERIATAVALPMQVLASLAKPAVVLLSGTTTGLLRLIGLRGGSAQDVTEEEIKHLVTEGLEQGVIDESERAMVNRALSFGDRTVDSVMTPRPAIVWLDSRRSPAENLAVMRETPYARYPVYRGSEQDVAGVLEIKTLIDALGSGGPIELFRKLAKPLFVPESARALHLIERFRESETQLALVVDEYGEIQGLVTLNDLLGAAFGQLAQPADEEGEPLVVQRSDGSFLIDGRVPVDDLREALGLGALPHESEQDYRTAAGLMIAHFGRIPQVGENFLASGWRFEVVDLDGARIDKLLVARVPDAPASDTQ
jgi:putative hemolysin